MGPDAKTAGSLGIKLRPLILQRAAASTIAQAAIEDGMRTLRVDGWNKVRAGITTIEEVLRVTQIEEHLDALVGGQTQILPKPATP